MVQVQWKTDALKALKKRLNYAAAQVSIKKVSLNPSHKNMTALYNKLVKKCKGANLLSVQTAWSAYTSAKAPDPAGAEAADPDVADGVAALVYR